MAKEIIWNNVAVKLPSQWEVTSEGGSKLYGVIVIAPEEGAKLEIYWKHKVRRKHLKEHEKYVKKLVSKGFEKIARRKTSVNGHNVIIEYLKSDDVKVFVATWNCNETDRFFIVQLDGTKASQALFTELLNSINCHPAQDEKLAWRLMGIGITLYTDYSVIYREFKIGYSMAHFVSKDMKVHVIQYAVPEYVLESGEQTLETLRERHLKMILPRFTFLDEAWRNNHIEYIIRNRVIKRIKYGYLLEKIINCRKPKYVQVTLVKTPSKRLDEARDIVESVACVEW